MGARETTHKITARVISLVQAALENPNEEPKLTAYWQGNEALISDHLRTNPKNKAEVLQAFGNYLEVLRPAENVSSSEIMKANQLVLRKLNCAYGMWALLAENGRKYYVRGRRTKAAGGWENQEVPQVEAYRWHVKARLDKEYGISGYTNKIKFYELASKAASAGTSVYCKNLARNLEAQALHTKADFIAKDKRKPILKRLVEAKKIYGLARDMANGTSQEWLMGFRENLCELRCALIELDVDRAGRAHNETISWARRFDDSERLFNRPNPWTSFKDFKNEEYFILVIKLLKERADDGLDQAIIHISQIITECTPGVRHSHLEVRSFFLKGLHAIKNRNSSQLRIQIRNLSNSLNVPVPRRDNKDLLTLLSEASEKTLAKVIEDALPLFPFDSQGKGHFTLPTLYYGFPFWLSSLLDSEEPDAKNLFMAWFARIISDYCWSIFEKKSEETGIHISERPPIWKASKKELGTIIHTLMSELQWEGPQRAALDSLCSWLWAHTRFTEEETEEIRAASERHVFPLVLGVETKPADECKKIVLARLDQKKATYTYKPSEIDERSLRQRNARAYVKSRFRAILQAPKEKGRPLYLYSAPNYPRFLRTCLIVEGQTDKEFFETLLDRIEPGWRLLRSEISTFAPIIEVRQAKGAGGIKREYVKARDEGDFHVHAATSDPGAERIVIVLDVDEIEVLDDDKLKVSKSFVLKPDLERVSAPAFCKALQEAIAGNIDHEGQQQIISLMSLNSADFESQISTQWGVRIKSKDQRFGKLLAQNFPPFKAQDASSEVWRAAYLTLGLAYGVSVTASDAISLPGAELIER
ncbi:MAG: hypothetical protein WAM62_04235 [Pseudolabrys sp.]